MQYEKPILAPVAKGTEIAKIIVTSPDFADKEFTLIAKDDVTELGWFGKLKERIKYLLGLQ